MVWNELLARISKGKEKWLAVKSNLGTDTESMEFLEGCYLVVSNRLCQFDIGFVTNIYEAVTSDHTFLKKTESNSEFISLCLTVKKHEQTLQKRPAKDKTYRKTANALNTARKLLENFSMTSLDLCDDLHVEVRFPTIDIDLIQKIKNHPLVDTGKTSRKTASIRVVL